MSSMGLGLSVVKELRSASRDYAVHLTVASQYSIYISSIHAQLFSLLGQRDLGKWISLLPFFFLF
jgi:hypothetical protein